MGCLLHIVVVVVLNLAVLVTVWRTALLVVIGKVVDDAMHAPGSCADQNVIAVLGAADQWT